MTVLAPGAVRVSQVVSPAPRAAWEALVAADPTSLVDQTPAWMDVMAASSGHRDASRLYLLDDGRRFVLPLARRAGLAGTGGVELGMPDGWGIGGLVGPDRDVDAIRAVLAELRYRGRLLTRIRPDPLDGGLWAAAAGPEIVRRPRTAHVLDLSAGVEALRAALHKSTRRKVSKAERAGLRITDTATPDHLAAYHHLFVLSLGRWAGRSREPQRLAVWRGVRRDPLRKLAGMADGLGDRFRLWMAWEGDDAVAGAIVLLGNASHYTRGAMDLERVGASQAPTLLQWLAIEEAAAAGCRTHHFGDTGSSTSLARFKEGFGARPVDYADFGLERLPVTRVDRALRTGVKRAIGFRDGACSGAALRLGTLVVVTAVGLAALGLGLGAGADTDREDRPAPLRERELPGTAHPPGDDLELVFSEDFDEPLDPDLWGRCHWWQAEACTIESNDELELYLPDNVTVDDDVLRLEARRETVEDPDGRAYPYSSGMISTGPPAYEEPARYAFTYGYVEARLRLPKGQGLWPAFWLLPADQESRPEIDIVETLGHRPDQAELHYHYLDTDGAEEDPGHEWSSDALADGDWHEFAVDWAPGRITWIIDGRARWEVTGDQVADEDLYLVLNLAVGGDWPGDPDEDTEFPAAVEAEWIRVWQ